MTSHSFYTSILEALISFLLPQARHAVYDIYHACYVIVSCSGLLLWGCEAIYAVLFVWSGKDATEDFEEIGHSNAAREMLDKYYIGEFEVSSKHPDLSIQLMAAGQWNNSVCREGKKLPTKW